jgi:shikimate kinase
MRSSKNSHDDIVLVGMMGTGKTTVGRQVSCRLNRPFVDSDEQVELQTGRTVREIFATDGEPAFRAEESEVLRQALAAPGGPRVITAAGGVVLDPTHRRWLCEVSNVVWLRAAPEVLAQRVKSADHRPLLEGDALATLTRMSREREALYDEVASYAVDTDELFVDDIVDHIVEWVTT